MRLKASWETMRKGRRLREPPGSAWRPHHTSPRSTLGPLDPPRGILGVEGLRLDQVAVFVRVPGRNVAFDGLGDSVLFNPRQLLIHGFTYELRYRAISAAVGEPLHPLELRLLGIDDCFSLRRTHDNGD